MGTGQSSIIRVTVDAASSRRELGFMGGNRQWTDSSPANQNDTR